MGGNSYDHLGNIRRVMFSIGSFFLLSLGLNENFCGSGSSESDAFGSHALSRGGGAGLGGADLGGVLGGDSSLSAGGHGLKNSCE